MVHSKLIAALLLIGCRKSCALNNSKIHYGRKLDNWPSMSEPCTLLLKEIQYEDGSKETKTECALSPQDGGQFVSLNFLLPDFTSGVDTFYSDEALISDNGVILPDGVSPTIEKGVYPTNVVTGDKITLVVRIKTNDSMPFASTSQMRDYVFGTSSNPVNLKSQCTACSYNKLTIVPASGETPGGDTIEDGVVDLTLSMNSNGVDKSAVQNAALQALAGLGSNNYIMLCIPPGTLGNWLAYAYVGSFLSVYNKEWCGRVSAQMHEVGHNFGFEHSGELSNEYADRTGMMGYSYEENDTPVMCYNAPKNVQTGWYADKEVRFNGGNEEYSISGLTDYDDSSSSEYTIVVIEKVVNNGVANVNDYYVSYNRAKTINIGTQKYGNEVLVHRAANLKAQSWLMAHLSNGESYVTDHATPITIEVKINDIDVAVVSLKTSSCIDDPFFVKSRGGRNRTCEYIGSSGMYRLKKWCSKKKRGKPIRESCCNTCLNF
mmetsp:Transcript_31727/g.62883  ORF Transcript_31727/g.62883 Transcript_31727/m.62883 type:complete len:489 (+) Transcript_31727:161-1627(+)|eukprot:CAMPEP_0194325154 /NCGR_PEP_ID=MMETSP0171-20130528/29072_1 /TAXON_ID=218684 /ORGANISM="Corethron pennatum, Strain L29A3" /LENGTH=488 /DNA_ID=CAMNT_0039084191 /DNA_START=158 /DNA_END=1624 /DNA_ORIENTATION=+